MRQRQCAFLTMQNPGDFVTDYDLSIAPMAELGWRVVLVNWRDRSIAWEDFDAVYICTPWDYLEDPALFLDVLDTIDKSTAVLVNDLALVHWTLEKTYLKDLEERGADVVPSTWYPEFDAENADVFFSEHNTDKLVLKPLIGANAVDTFVLTKPIGDTLCRELTETFRDRPFFVQPFIANIQSEGEFSLFFLGDAYSHAILKTPKAGDFRVQEEHGAEIKAITPPDRLIDIATRTMGLVKPEPVYARIDFVRDDDDRYLLMELELIEPSLYLRTDSGAAMRFAAAFDAHVRNRSQD
ncbi:MAG: hypothetical protein OER97_02425 [Gammaproteobacteria bacterium]|nr:hypothetical protein [Gammaproteobacteria bacterium]